MPRGVEATQPMSCRPVRRQAGDLVYYTVSGPCPFPIDMLRYDLSFPATEEAAHVISRSIDRSCEVDGQTGFPDDQLVITLCHVLRDGGGWEPTDRRWRSRGWRVIARSWVGRC